MLCFSREEFQYSCDLLMKIQKLEKERRATDSGSESQVLVLDEL